MKITVFAKERFAATVCGRGFEWAGRYDGRAGTGERGQAGVLANGLAGACGAYRWAETADFAGNTGFMPTAGTSGRGKAGDMNTACARRAGHVMTIETKGETFVFYPLSGKQEIVMRAGFPLEGTAGTEVYATPYGTAVRLEFSPRPAPFVLLHQRRHGDTLVTAYSEGRVRVVAENKSFAAVAEGFGSGFDSVERNGRVYCFSAGRPHFVAVFETRPFPRTLFAGEAEEFEISPLFRTKRRLYDLERTTADVEWTERDGRLYGRVLETATENPAERGMHPRILGRIFMERVINGLDFLPISGGEIRKNPDKLKEFVGGATGILPDVFEGQAAVYRGGVVRVFVPEVEDGLVVNLREI